MTIWSNYSFTVGFILGSAVVGIFLVAMVLDHGLWKPDK